MLTYGADKPVKTSIETKRTPDGNKIVECFGFSSVLSLGLRDLCYGPDRGDGPFLSPSRSSPPAPHPARVGPSFSWLGHTP